MATEAPSSTVTGPVTGDRREVIVVGGGQAGLAVGYLLARQGRRFTILEAADTPAAAWRSRWDSLRLFTPVRDDSLPGRAFPGDPDSYPGRDDVVAYLTDYARDLDLPVELGSAVRAVRNGNGSYLVDLDDRTYEAEQVVIATGPFQVPRIPEVADRLNPDILQLHSSRYRGPQDVPAGPVLVVGGGNTGFQIAEELSRTHEVHLAVGSRQTPLPQRVLGRDLFRYLEATGLMRASVESRIGRRLRQRETLIGSSPRVARRRHGIDLHGRAVDTSGADVRCADGTRVTPGAVIWATGFALDHSIVALPVFDAVGGLVHRRGVTASPGLFFLGLPWQHTRGSALLGWVKDDAEHVAEQIAALAGTGTTPARAALAAEGPAR
jgi:putative flavoprotein involved in K+ transport